MPASGGIFELIFLRLCLAQSCEMNATNRCFLKGEIYNVKTSVFALIFLQRNSLTEAFKSGILLGSDHLF